MYTSTKLIFLDIDGTLVAKENYIPPSAREALDRAKANGHKIFISSGRCMDHIPESLRELGFDGYVASTGAVVIADGKEIFVKTMIPEKVGKMFDILQEGGASYYTLTLDGVHIEPKEQAKFLVDPMGMDRKFVEHMVPDPELRYKDISTSMDYLKADITVEELCRRIDAAGLGDYFHAEGASWGNDQIYTGEITMVGVTKGTGIRQIAAHYGMGIEDTIGLGDGMNDIEMLRTVHTGVAMGNAVQELKEIADFVTKNILDDGLAYAFEQLGLI